MSQFLLPAVGPGTTVGLITPASGVEPEAVAAGLQLLQQLGIRYQFGAHAFSRDELTAAPPADRLADIHRFFANPDVQALWAMRGGYGTMQLLDRLDYSLLAERPKLLVGFSDVTALQWAIYRQIRLPSLSGLTLSLQFRQENAYLPIALEILDGRRTGLTADELLPEALTVHRRGAAQGTFLCGTLSMIGALCGTPFFPEQDDLILLIEDIEEPLYRVDRLLQQLRLSGFWERVRAVILGKFIHNGQILEVAPLVEAILPQPIPLISNFPYGHLTASLPMPNGVSATLVAQPFSLQWRPFLKSVLL